MEGFAVFSFVIAVTALALVLGERRRGSKDREGEDLPEDVVGLRQEVAALRAEAAGALRHLGMVRYDAYPDAGGRLSWSVALVDDSGDGILLTSIHGRSEARSYAKSLSDFSCEQPLSPEEAEALDRARG